MVIAVCDICSRGVEMPCNVLGNWHRPDGWHQYGDKGLFCSEECFCEFYLRDQERRQIPKRERMPMGLRMRREDV